MKLISWSSCEQSDNNQCEFIIKYTQRSAYLDLSDLWALNMKLVAWMIVHLRYKSDGGLRINAEPTHNVSILNILYIEQFLQRIKTLYWSIHLKLCRSWTTRPSLTTDKLLRSQLHRWLIDMKLRITRSQRPGQFISKFCREKLSSSKYGDTVQINLQHEDSTRTARGQHEDSTRTAQGRQHQVQENHKKHWLTPVKFDIPFPLLNDK